MGRRKRNEQGGLMAKGDALECMTPKRFATQGRQEMDETFLPTLGHKEGASMPKRPIRNPLVMLGTTSRLTISR